MPAGITRELDSKIRATLLRERDRQAEQRRADALDNLIEILVDAFVKELKRRLREDLKIKVATGVPGM